MKMLQKFLFGCAALSTIACSVGPKYKTPSVQVPTAFKETQPAAFKEQTPFQPSAPKDDSIRGDWWTIFGDPVLNGLEDQVNINNQTIAQAEAQFRQARAAVRAARSGLFPTITTAPFVTRSRQSANRAIGVGGVSGVNTTSGSTTGTTTGTDTGTTTGTTGTGSVTGVTGIGGRTFTDYQIPFDVSWEIDAWGRIRHLIEANVANTQASASDIETARLSAHSELATDYWELRGSDLRKQLLQQTVNDYQQQLQLTQARFDQGIATELDVEQARTQLETTRAQLIDVEIQRAQYEHAIAVLIGKAPASLTVGPSPTVFQPPVIPVAVPSELLQRRPDIASAERRVAAQNAQIGVAQAAFYPAIQLSASAGLASSSISNLFTWPSRLWSVGPALAQTLFDAGSRRAVTAEAQASYDANVATYRQTVLAAFQDVEDNLASLRVLEEEGKQQQTAVNASQRALNLSETRYQGGVATYLDVITTENTALTTRSTAVDILTRRMTASVGLIRALGGGWNTGQIPGAKDLISKQPLPDGRAVTVSQPQSQPQLQK